MCKSCDCDNYEKCSIVGYMPIGYCCSLCNQYEEHKTCINEEDKEIPVSGSVIKLIKSEIKDNDLFIIIEKEGKEFKLRIDLKTYLK